MVLKHDKNMMKHISVFAQIHQTKFKLKLNHIKHLSVYCYPATLDRDKRGHKVRVLWNASYGDNHGILYNALAYSVFPVYISQDAVSPVWEQKCLQAFHTSAPGTELDACLWSLTEVQKGLLKGANRGKNLDWKTKSVDV